MSGFLVPRCFAHGYCDCLSQVFNTRKTSPVFTPGAEAEVPPVFIDRFGAKAWTSYTGGDNDKFENAFLLQKVGRSGQACAIAVTATCMAQTVLTTQQRIKTAQCIVCASG